jgi:hypothetical protein
LFEFKLANFAEMKKKTIFIKTYEQVKWGASSGPCDTKPLPKMFPIFAVSENVQNAEIIELWIYFHGIFIKLT